MKNFKNTLTNKNSNSNRKPHYKAISLASLSTLALTLTLGDAGIANAMMTKVGAVKFFGSNGVRTIAGVHNKLPSSTTSGPLKVGGDIAGRFNNTGKIGTTSTTSKPPASPVKTYKSILNIQLKGNTSGLGSGGSSQTKKPTTTPTINQNTSTLPNTSSSSTTGKKPTTTTTQLGSNVNYTKDGTPYITQDGENFIYLKSPNGTTKINMDFDKDGNPIYYTKNPSGSVTYLQKVGHDDGGIGDFRPTPNNKPVISVGTQTDPDITGVNTNTLTSKKPTNPNQSSSNDGKYNATLVVLDDDGNIIQQNNASSSILKPTTGNQQSSTQINDDVDGINSNTLVSKKPTTGVGQFGDDDIDAGNKNTLTSKKPITTTNQFDDNDSIKNSTLQIKDDGDGQPNNADATTVQTGTGSGNKKLTKRDKIALGVVGGVASLGTILGLSIGLTNNGGNNSNKNNDGTPPKLVPVPESPRYSISVVNSPEGNLFTDN